MTAFTVSGAAHMTPLPHSVSAWDRIGPWNLFNDKDPLKGEAGTIACAASPAANPDVIYAGGQNNGVSSGIIKTTDGGKHWARKSKGLWDTRVLGVWVHPDEPSGSHVLAGTHSGIYESRDAAESWTFRNETKGWGGVMSFREGLIQGHPYILANGADGYIFNQPKKGGMWKRIKAPGGIANNAHLSVVTHDGHTEVVTCVGGWGGGSLYYGLLVNETNATWTGPVQLKNDSYKTWGFFPGTSEIYGRCQKPDQCDADVHPLGRFDDLASCQKAVNATTNLTVASYTYQHNVSGLGDYAGWCYVISTFAFDPQPQSDVDSGRAPGLFPGGDVDCSNVAVDPADRDHILFSKGGQFHAYESKDAGKTVREFTHSSAFFVMIDSVGWFYTATQSGAFVSTDGGDNWTALHVFMTSDAPTPGRIIDRVPHDYQRIVPDFRTDQVSLPSDQGLHIVNRSAIQAGEFNLTIATGDMRNTMALSAILGPSTTTPGSRNLIVNLWDWNVGASWDDGASWEGWVDGEASPGYCGEGGGGTGLGASGYMLMAHHSWITVSSDGGHNWVRHDLPGGAGAFEYVRRPGSRTEPSGTWFALMGAPPPSRAAEKGRARANDDDDDDHDDEAIDDDDDDDDDDRQQRASRKYSPSNDEGDDDDHDDDDDDEVEEMDPDRVGYKYVPGLQPRRSNGDVQYLMTTTNFGANWTWIPMPDDFQAGQIVSDPTDGKSLFGLTSECLAHSGDLGATWSACWNKTGLSGDFSRLLIKDSSTLFMIRKAAVPLRTTDGGETWTELTAAAPLFKFGATFDGSISWSGRTLVLSGADLGAVDRGTYGTAVWKSSNDGDDWVDETGDLVTISPGPGVWYEKDFYFVTRGEGVTVKRGFEQ